jgi:hypothetical protein
MERIKFRFIDPKEIIAVIVILIVIGVGAYAFFVTSTTLTNTGAVTTPVGNNGVLSASKAIQGWTGAPIGNARVFIPVSSSATNTTGNVGVIKLEAWNVSQGGWVRIYCENGTFISGNNTYRVRPRTVNGSSAWTYFRLTYNIAGTATSKIVNQSWKSLRNESGVGGSVFNILGICITISAIMGIIGVIYSYMRPK